MPSLYLGVFLSLRLTLLAKIRRVRRKNLDPTWKLSWPIKNLRLSGLEFKEEQVSFFGMVFSHPQLGYEMKPFWGMSIMARKRRLSLLLPLAKLSALRGIWR